MISFLINLARTNVQWSNAKKPIWPEPSTFIYPVVILHARWKIIMAYFDTKYEDNLYVVFRVGIGALFLMLGVQKLFGLWNMPGGAAVFGTLVWYAGIFEAMIGLSLVTGVLTRLASAFGIIMMIVAYYIGHVSVGGWNPAVNMGMPALVFMLAFIVTLAYGAKKSSLEKTVFKKEFF